MVLKIDPNLLVGARHLLVRNDQLNQDHTKNIGNVKQAERILKAYAEDLEGLTAKECAEVGFSQPQCEALVQALGKGEEGVITDDEQKQLETAGFAKEFVKAIAGEKGRNALERRTWWFVHRPHDFWVKIKPEVRKEAFPLLMAALKENDYYLNVKAIRALGSSRDVRAIPLLIAIIKQKEGLGMEAYHALRLLEPFTVSATIKVLKNSEKMELVSIEDEIVPQLVKALGNEDPHLRWLAVYTLRKIATDYGVKTVAPCISELRRMAKKDPDSLTQQTAQKVVEELMEGEIR